MFSVMTVVLPQQHSKGGPQGAGRGPSTGGPASAGASSRGQQCQSCDCRCVGPENLAKNSVPMRCPFVKGYPGDGCRHHPMDPTGRMHPMSAREWESLRDAACFWKDKYDRLYENQRRLQKINESLEEKLLHIAEKFENEKSDLTKDVSDLTSRLVEARLTIAELEEENEQYRNDCNIAVRLLQCKPSSFVAHKFNSLPADFQAKVKRHMNRPAKNGRGSSSLLDQCPPDVRTIKVSVPTLPPANMVYSVNKTSSSSNTSTQAASTTASTEEATPDHVSAAIIAKVIEERNLERKSAASTKKRNIDSYRETILHNIAIQTDYQRPLPCRCQYVQKLRNVQSDGEAMRASKDPCMSNSTETAI